MKRYTKELIMKMVKTAGGVPKLYKPFPGRIPTRLFIQIKAYNEKKNSYYTIFKYSGKFCSDVLLQAAKIKEEGAKTLIIQDSIVEYHCNGILFYCTGGISRFYPYHNLVHLDSPYPVGRDQWAVPGFKPYREKAINCWSFRMFVRVGKIVTTSELRRIYRARQEGRA